MSAALYSSGRFANRPYDRIGGRRGFANRRPEALGRRTNHPDDRTLIASRSPGWTEKRDGFTIIAAVDAEILLVHGNHCVAGEKFAQPNEA